MAEIDAHYIDHVNVTGKYKPGELTPECLLKRAFIGRLLGVSSNERWSQLSQVMMKYFHETERVVTGRASPSKGVFCSHWDVSLSITTIR